eukprot:Gb_18361 [translate_table: standard]
MGILFLISLVEVIIRVIKVSYCLAKAGIVDGGLSATECAGGRKNGAWKCLFDLAAQKVLAKLYHRPYSYNGLIVHCNSISVEKTLEQHLYTQVRPAERAVSSIWQRLNFKEAEDQYCFFDGICSTF